MKVSLVVTTYNWPGALKEVLRSAIEQDYAPYEIIVADDGSDIDTKEVVNSFIKKNGVRVHHEWHKDLGFRAALIRNKAVAVSTGSYIIFIDGDCILPPSFIKKHVKLSRPGFFIAGSRVKINDKLTGMILNEGFKFYQSLPMLFRFWLKGGVKRIHPVLTLPDMNFRTKRPTRWQGAVTCNLSMWKEDFYAVNGFDNSFYGWGLEDSDLVARLINSGVYRKDGKFYSYVLHLYHEEKDRSYESVNFKILQDTLAQNKIRCLSGVNEV